MKYKHILGLDIGTNSLGWSLIKEYEDTSIEIIKTGVHIFPIGTRVDEVTGKEKTKNEQRRSYRGASRNRYRFKLRRKNLKRILEKLGMLPDYSVYYKEKGKGQSYELYKLRSDAIDSAADVPLKELGRIFMLLNKYRGFKSNAKKLGVKDQDAGIVVKGYAELQELMKRRQCKTIGEYFFKMHELGKEWYEQDKWHNPNEPIDERAFNENDEFILFNSNGIRRHFGRYTLRDMYLNEFDEIWRTQKSKENYPEIFTGSKAEYDAILTLPHKEKINALKEFKKTNYWQIRDYCIYYQRPLKSAKRFISNCQLERGEYEIKQLETEENNSEKLIQKKIWKKKARKGAPKSHPYFQEFRIWQKLHQISYSSVSEDVFQQGLKREWFSPIAELMMLRYEIYLNKTPKVEKDGKLWIGKILKDNKLIADDNDYTFFIDKTDEDVIHDEKNANRITGNVTYASFIEALGKETFEKLINETTVRKEQLSSSETIEVLEPKIIQLWQTLYMARDGLFREEEWLRSILSENSKWGFDEAQINRLIENGLIPDYGAYSIKVLKAILPSMRKGLSEYEALKATNRGYINDDNTIGKKVQLKGKISQLKYQELRNPVVEKALSKTIKLVNVILERYDSEMNRDNFEIRIESTRQLRKPRSERENERRKNIEKDKLRQNYATFLTKYKDEIGINRIVHKNDSLVGKYELWLEMNMNEDDEIFKSEFKSFNKITKDEDRLKHKLWLECGRRCPYTGKTINLTDLFSSNVEIEHIIPMSRSLNDSFINKTLCYRTTNALKGKMTSMEFATKNGKSELSRFKNYIKNGFHHFSEEKKKLFLAENVPIGFSNNQLANTSYIAKFTKTKMQEVCKNVQFTNGSATWELRNYDWLLSNLLDKIRYEEETGVDMDEIYTVYYRYINDFKNWYRKKYKTTDFDLKKIDLKTDLNIKIYITETNNDVIYFFDEIEKFKQYRNKNGKKDRSDHRHHAIDAFLTASCSPRIVQLLSTFNALKEEGKLEEREKVERNFNYLDLKDSIKNILVSHSEKQTLIKKRTNRVKTKQGIKKQITYAPQGKLHEESFYTKRNGNTVRRVKLFDPQAQQKVAFSSVEKLNYEKGEKWPYVADKELYEIVKSRLQSLGKAAFTKESMEQNPFYRASPLDPIENKSKKGKPLPIVKSVRKVFNVDRTLIQLPAKDENGKVINGNRYADNESNYIQVFYKNGKKKFARPVTFFNAVKNKRCGELIFPDEIEYKDLIYGVDSEMPFLKVGDIIIVHTLEEKGKLEDLSFIKERLYKVNGIGTLITPNKEYGNYEYGRISLHKIKIAKIDGYPNQKDIEKAVEMNSFTMSHDKFNGTRVRINILGEIEIIKDE